MWAQTAFPYGGYAIFFCGGAVSFAARKLKIVPRSSAEAETAVYASTAKDLRFILNVLGCDGLQIDLGSLLPVNIYCDNQAAVTNITNVGATARTRHYENWLNYGREQYLNKVSKPVWVETREQVADIFTKALDKTTFLRLRAMLLNISSDLVSTQMRDRILGPYVG